MKTAIGYALLACGVALGIIPLGLCVLGGWLINATPDAAYNPRIGPGNSKLGTMI